MGKGDTMKEIRVIRVTPRMVELLSKGQEVCMNENDGSEIILDPSMQDDEKLFPNVEGITLVVKSFHGDDHYWEEDRGEGSYGYEHHSIRGKTTISLVECKDPADANKKYEEIMDRNADNPPYDKYDVVLAYWTISREHIPIRQLTDESFQNAFASEPETKWGDEE
jgi:hypothetical protein